MFKLIKRLSSTDLTLLVIVLVLIMSDCDVSGEQNNEETAQPRFSYEIYDENGVMLKKVTDESVGETEIETSLGLFGDQFVPPRLVERIAEETGRDPDEFRRHEIWLHAEEGISEDVQFVTLRFGFPFMEQWEKGTYQVPEITKEEWLERLRRIWESIHDYLDAGYGKQNYGILTETEEQMATMDYYDSGFVTERSYGLMIDSTNYIYQSTGGSVELENVTDNRVEGSFTVDLMSLPMKTVFFADEFPEDPAFRTYRITGDFATEHGDYDDLVEGANIVLFEIMMQARKTVFR